MLKSQQMIKKSSSSKDDKLETVQHTQPGA